MDIDYLLSLQSFRGSINDALTPAMEWISMAATTYLILIPVFWYWNRDKGQGLYALVSYYFCMFLTPIIKLTACVYRPWIRSGDIRPAGDAISTATGYSFPSGHTTTCAPLAGGMAANLWENRRARWASVLLVIFILLTAFSRNYLGVHTPQDVLVALALSALSLFAAGKLLGYLRAHPDHEDFFLATGLCLCALGLVYITNKAYPMDYSAEGKLIVDPQKMMIDGYGDIGKVMGFIIARFIEKKWIRFRPLKGGWVGVLICLAGLVPMVLMKAWLKPVSKSLLGDHWGALAFSVLHAFYYIALFPLVLKLCGKHLPGGAAQAVRA